ncbi:MAG: fucose isomerase [Clostridia bacterium]|nr:fucose isomerase [Clostridia bacterium]
MYKEQLILGVVPTKRGFLPMEEAKRQKDRFMARIASFFPEETVRLVTIDDVAENGILFDKKLNARVVDKMRTQKIDALFVPFCDFGEEECAAGVAGALKVPTLVWGARDERPNSAAGRGRDTQCGIFAATKVMRRYGVTFSYIWNCETESEDFRVGFDRFVRTAAVIKALKNLRIAKIGERPAPFMSVQTNEADLINGIGAVTVPIDPAVIARRAKGVMEENGAAYREYAADLLARFDSSREGEENVRKIAALKMAMKEMILENGCSCAATECWSSFRSSLGVSPCAVLGELSDEGIPVSCECDVNGAVTMAILRALNLYREPTFLADLTIRHPGDDNAELLWHCGPFPYLLKDEGCQACLENDQEQFVLRDGRLTLCRFDDLDGKYYLFAGEGDTTKGPETTGTYVYLKTDNWKRWEEKLVFGPYIHHVGGVYGAYKPVLREVARYMGFVFDDADEQGTYSL